MEIVETWINEDGGISTLYRDKNDFSEQDKLEAQIYARLDAEKYAYLKKKEDINEKSKYYWICINPNPNITLQMFREKMEKMMSKVWIKHYLYVYEQRGEYEAEAGRGYHFHAIIEKPDDKGYKHIFREISNSANAVCDTTSFNFFQFQAIGEAEKDRKIVYITGRKTDPSKWAKQDMDILWRPKVNIKPYYNHGIM